VALGLLLLQTIPPTVAMQEHEIAYDNGSPAGSVSLPYTPTTWSGGEPEKQERDVWIGNQMLAVRFTSDNSTVEMLRRVRFYVTGDLQSFNVYAFDSDRQFFIFYLNFNLYSPGSQEVSRVHSWTVTPLSTGWVDLDLTGETNPIFVAGDFYVAAQFTVAQMPKLGVDTTGLKTDRSWLVKNQTEWGWISYSTYAEQHGLADGNLMIRAVVARIPQGTNESTSIAPNTNNAAPTSELFLAIPAAILVVASIGIWWVGKRRKVT